MVLDTEVERTFPLQIQTTIKDPNKTIGWVLMKWIFKAKNLFNFIEENF